MTHPHRVEVPSALDGERVDRVVSFVTGLPRTEAVGLIERGDVAVGGRTVVVKSQRVSAGQLLDVAMPEPAAPPGADAAVELTVVYADEAVIVVDKQPGLVVHPGAGNRDGTLVNGILARFPDVGDGPWPDSTRPGIVHRLDKGTSGLLMVARTPTAGRSLAGQLKRRTVERRYLALVWGEVDQPSGMVDAPIGRSISSPTKMSVRGDGRRAVTRYDVERRWLQPQPAALLRCVLETGRTHQIRVHLAAIGHPVVGDDRYIQGATTTSHGRHRHGVVVAPGLGPGRPFLHAAVLGFDHPTSGERLRFESPLPPDLAQALDVFT